MIGSAGKVTLSRRSHPQPSPHIHNGGDCGACALGGALGIPIADVYSRFDTQGISNAHEMGRCLRCSISEDLADRMIDQHAEWPTTRYWRSFGSPSFQEHVSWFNHVRMAIDAGYYGLATVIFNPTIGNGLDTDHWVLICGARSEGPVPDKLLTGDVLVSCSVRGEHWHEARDFLKTMGGYDVLFVRPVSVP